MELLKSFFHRGQQFFYLIDSNGEKIFNGYTEEVGQVYLNILPYLVPSTITIRISCQAEFSVGKKTPCGSNLFAAQIA